MFPYAKFRYEYDDFSRIHVIEASPSSIFSNADFRKVCCCIQTDVRIALVNESVLFQTSESYLAIENCIYEQTGVNYENDTL